MPNAHRSFYADEVGGYRHWTHLSEELPAGLDPRDDLFALLRTTPADRLPALMVRCGEDDARIAMNTRFADALAEHGVEADVAWTPGDHTWDFWDAHIQDVLAWLPLRAPV